MKRRGVLVSGLVFLVSVMFAPCRLLAQGKERPVEHPASYRTMEVDGLSIFYRGGPWNTRFPIAP